MNSFGIVGYGYVGKAFARMVNCQNNKVIVYDPFLDKEFKEKEFAEHGIIFADEISELKDCELGVVCVPTPSSKDGSCDTSIVEESVAKLETPVILIKSTVKPGTTDDLINKTGKRIVFSPEYVGEGKYYVTPRLDFQTDMKKTPFLICGGNSNDCSYVIDMLVPILGPEKEYYICEAIEAEIIKYMENTYFATKITFAQEMYEIVKAHKANWHRVWRGWALDPRVDIMHTAVFPKARGFSGKCLPKDANALVKSSIEHGYRPDFLIEMIKTNSKFRPDEPIRIKE